MNGSGIQDIVGDVRSIKSLFAKRRKQLREEEDTTPSFKRGGRMKRRGVAKLHKGERISRR